MIGVIALIATPVIIGVISKTERQAFERSIDGLLETVRLDYSTDSFMSPREYYYAGKDLILLTVNDETKDENVGMKGKIEGKGFIYIDEEGVIHIENICSKKYCANGEENKIEITENELGVIPEVGKNDPIIRLIGEKTVYVNLGEVYEESGAVAKTKSGKELEYTKEITISDAGEIVSEIDTSIENTYVITYKTENEGKEASVTRTVVVLDMKPLIDIPEGSDDYEKGKDILISASAKVSPNKITSFIVEIKKGEEVIETKTVTGPSIIIELLETGIYEVKVTVTDSNNRTNTMTRTYKIDSEPPKITFAPETEIITLKENEVAGFDFKNDKTVSVTDNIELKDWWVEGALSAVASDEVVKIKYVAIDKAGNMTEEYRRFLVELADGPVFSFDSMGSNGKWIKATKVPFEVEIRGENNELISLSYQIDNGDEVTKVNVEITNNKVMSVEVPLNTTGKHRITVKAKGRYGNETSADTGEFWIDAEVPTLTVRNDSVKYGTDKELDTLYEARFGEMDGNVVCKNGTTPIDNINKIKQAGTYSIKCTAIGNNEKRSGEKTMTLTLQNRTFPEIMSGTGRFNEEAKTFEEIMEPLLKQGTSVQDNDPDHNWRYVGSNPDNYVSFNGKLWRIIGLFDGQAKIIEESPYRNMAWDYGPNDGGTHGTYGLNDWSGATSQIELNTTYLSSIGASSKNYIDLHHEWRVGGVLNSNMKRSDFYQEERSTEVYGNNHPTWEGAIGLMYPSDYAYATSGGSICEDKLLSAWNEEDAINECAKKSWLFSANHQWMMTHIRYNGAWALWMNSVGQILGESVIWNGEGVPALRPTLYLKSNIKVKSGNGTKTDPFILTEAEVDARDPDHNIRYVGSNPNNYIRFNDEIWRVIGEFDNRIKIVRDTYSQGVWDNDPTHGANGWNDWNNATLQKQLNRMSIKENEYVIDNYTWPLGALENSAIPRKTVYEQERKDRAFLGNQPTWQGKFGLIHVSDYAYATSGDSVCERSKVGSWAETIESEECAKKSWLRKEQWTLTISDGRSYVNYIGNTGYVYSFDYFVNGIEVATNRSATFAYAPVLYLKDSIKIKGGTGTSDDPYILTM